jgi:hypothetical protein
MIYETAMRLNQRKLRKSMRFRDKTKFVLWYGGLIQGVLLLGVIQVILSRFDIRFHPKIRALDSLEFYLSWIATLTVQFLIGCGGGLALWGYLERQYKKPFQEPLEPKISEDSREPPGEKQSTPGQSGGEEIRRGPGWSVAKEFPPVVVNALPQIDEIQKGSLRYILGHLGVGYVPQLAIDVMIDLRRDAVSCFFAFLTRIRVDPDRLLADGSLIEKSKLEETVGILLEADDIRRDFNVSPIPIYESLNESLKKAENLLEKMHLVADVLKRLDSSKVVFYKYRRWFQNVRETLEHWERYDSREIKEVQKYAERYESWQNQYDQFIEYILIVSDKLRGSATWDRYETKVNQILEDVSDIESQLINEPDPADMRGELDIEKALMLLATIRDELEKLFNEAAGSSFNFKDVLCQKIEKALKVLGLKLGATLQEIKQAYRKLAQKYHPDTHPGDKAAEEMMKSLTEAFHFLRKNL